MFSVFTGREAFRSAPSSPDSELHPKASKASIARTENETISTPLIRSTLPTHSLNIFCLRRAKPGVAKAAFSVHRNRIAVHVLYADDKVGFYPELLLQLLIVFTCSLHEGLLVKALVRLNKSQRAPAPVIIGMRHKHI